MKKTKIITLILASIIIISVFVYFILFKNSQPKLIENIQTQTTTFEDKKIEENEVPFKINITYPSIKNQDNFNKLAKEIIDTELLEFKKNSVENDKAVKATDPENYAKYPREYDLIISYDKGQIDEYVASVVFEVYKFEGGAHGATYQIPLNYNFQNQAKISLEDFFGSQENYLQKISDFCRQDLTNQIITKNGSIEGVWIADGIAPMKENFSTFLINQEGVTFYFPPYQVAPYSFGKFKVIMPNTQ
jgi:hypothetical protein